MLPDGRAVSPRCRWVPALGLLGLLAVTAGCGGLSTGSSAAGRDYRLVNLAGYPSDALAVGNTMDDLRQAAVDPHPEVSLQLVATGSRPVTVTQVDTPDGWALRRPALPVTVAPRHRVVLAVQMSRTGTAGLYTGALVVHTDSGRSPEAVVQLRGYEQVSAGPAKEPSLQQLVTLFGWRTVVVGPGQHLRPQPGRALLVGQEVRAAGFARARPTAPVTVRQLAAFRQGTAPGTLARSAVGSGARRLTLLFVRQPSQSQTVLPAATDGGPAVARFTPAGEFTLVVDGQDVDDRRNAGSGSRAGTDCASGCGHRLRVYPVVGPNGRPLHDSWLLAIDEGDAVTDSGRGDYQDAVYLLSNARPLPPSAVPAPAPPPAGKARAALRRRSAGPKAVRRPGRRPPAAR